VSNYNLVGQLEQEFSALDEAWLAAHTVRYRNARGALQAVLTLFANRDPRFQSSHAEIVRVREALGELRRIEERMATLLDELDRASS
jgi:hypothetical protein